jgi:serine/threonine protein kinase
MEKKDTKKTKNISNKSFMGSNHYIGIEKLGKGTYGSVYKAQKRETREYYAIKKIKLDVETEGIPSTALREISILKAVRHPNIVSIVGLHLSEKKIELCLEFFPLDLKKMMDQYKNNSKVYNLNNLKTIIYQILKATDYLHSRKILHRDLKPQNILICDQTLITKVADFGLSRVYSIPIRPYTKEVLTLWYRAPELMMGLSQYSIGLDMWSIGCIFAEMLIKTPLFPGDSEIDQQMKIFRLLGTPNDKTLPGCKYFPDYNRDLPLWEENSLETYLKDKLQVEMNDYSFREAMSLLKKMLVLDPCERISAKEALEHVNISFNSSLSFRIFISL